MRPVNNLFRKIAAKISWVVGTPWAFLLAISVIAIWALTGPSFNYSNTWQLVINTGTTIVTFLMVFLIQNTQNRDSKAIHLKLDELIKASQKARNKLVDAEDLSDEELEELHRQSKSLHEEYDKELKRRKEKK
jgi:low affinity Fe/Cu permease